MSEDRNMKPAKRKKRRRWPWVVAALLVAVVAATKAVEYVLHVDRYRPKVVERIGKATGLPASIDRLDLDLLPVPSLDVEGVSLGEADFRASAEQVELHLRVASLLRGAIEITEVEVDGLEITLPEDAETLKQRAGALGGSPQQGGSGLEAKVAVNRVYARNAVLRLGEGREPFAVIDVDVHDVLSDVIAADLAAELPQWGESARVHARARIRPPRGDAGLDATGTVSFTNVDLPQLVGGPGLPDVRVDLTAEVDKATKDAVSAAVSGTVRAAKGAPEQVSALTGEFVAKAWWSDNTLTVNDLQWEAPGVRLMADLTRYPDGKLGCNVREALVNSSGLSPFLAATDSEAFRLVAESDAALDVRDLLIGADSENGLRLASGSGALNGIHLLLADGTRAFSNIRGNISVQDGRFTIESLESEKVQVKGTITPDFKTKCVTADLSGQAELSRERLATFFDPGPVVQVEGSLTVDRLAATFGPGQDWTAGLVVEGSLARGVVALDTAAFSGAFTGIEAQLTADAQSLRATGAGQSTQFGSVGLDATYDFAPRTISGVARADVTSWELPLERDSAGALVASAWLAELGASRFDFAIGLPSPDAQRVTIRATREGEPALTGELAVVGDEQAWRLGPINASGSVPLRVLRGAVSKNVAFSGNAGVTFERTAEGGFVAHCDATPCSVSVADYLHKPPDQPLTVAVTGYATDDGWTAKALTIACVDQTFEGRFENDRLRFDPLDLDIASFAVLLPQGAKASGRVAGSVATNPLELDLRFENAGMGFGQAPAEEEQAPGAAAIDSINGALSYRDGAWTCTDLTLHGAGSECVLNAGWRGASWEGRLTGSKLDINALTALYETASAFSTSQAGPQETDSAGPAMTGRLAVDLDQVVYLRGQFDDVRAVILFAEDGTKVRDLSARPYTGAIEGTADIGTASADGIRDVALDLQCSQIDARIVDELAFTEPRRFTGTLDGTIALAFPAGGGIDPTDHVTGTIEFQGEKGSFGKLGIATKLLTVLRTTELFRLRMPKLTDQGLAYDTCQASASFENGFMTLQQFGCKNPTLQITGKGSIDFPQDATDLAFQVSLLGTVTGIMEAVGLDGAAQGVRNYGSFYLAATGPPASPDVRIVKGAAVDRVQDTVKDTVKDAVKGSGDAVKGLVENAAGDALRSILGE